MIWKKRQLPEIVEVVEDSGPDGPLYGLSKIEVDQIGLVSRGAVTAENAPRGTNFLLIKSGGTMANDMQLKTVLENLLDKYGDTAAVNQAVGRAMQQILLERDPRRGMSENDREDTYPGLMPDIEREPREIIPGSGWQKSAPLSKSEADLLQKGLMTAVEAQQTSRPDLKTELALAAIDMVSIIRPEMGEALAKALAGEGRDPAAEAQASLETMAQKNDLEGLEARLILRSQQTGNIAKSRRQQLVEKCESRAYEYMTTAGYGYDAAMRQAAADLKSESY